MASGTAFERVGADATRQDAAESLLRALAELLPRVIQRDEHAFSRFYDLTVGKAHALVRRIVGDSQVDDVLEESYWQAWRDAGRYDSARGNVLAWFLVICRSRALDHLRRADQAEPHPDPQVLAEEAAACGSPLDLLIATQAGSAVHAALAELPVQERQLVALAFFRDLSHQEIADACKMPLGSVKTVLHRAFGKLRRVLKDSDWSPSHV
jgi:RNA polymerase sigma factor (sigma-70 family)